MHNLFFKPLVLHSISGFGQNNYNLKIVDDESKNQFSRHLSIQSKHRK